MTRLSLSQLVSFATVAFMALVTVNGTQVIRRSHNFGSHKRFLPTNYPDTLQKRANGKASFGYYTNWSPDRNFMPTDVVTSFLTHIIYSFADIDPGSGAISLSNLHTDTQMLFPGDSGSDPDHNLYGCLKQFYLQKLRKRNLKILLSIGGGTNSNAGHFNFVTDSGIRASFVSSAVQLIEDYGFDGVDIDYEYPANTAQGQGLADLLTELRTAFTALQNKKGDNIPYQITAAVSDVHYYYQWYNVPQMDAALDHWNLMGYDNVGPWSNHADNQANLYGGSRTAISSDSAIQWYVGQGASISKINLGMPLYGYSFENTAGLGASYNGMGPGEGVYGYNVLPRPGASVVEDTTDVASYSYDSTKKEFVTYDTPNIAKLKAQYINSKGLGGSMFWELSTDKVGADSLVGIVSDVFGSLNETQNHISYPDSKFENVRNNMGVTPEPAYGAPAPATTQSPAETTPVTAPPAIKSPTSGGGCDGVSVWVAAKVYTKRKKVSYNGHVWTAKWWTENDTPGGPAGVWTDSGAC